MREYHIKNPGQMNAVCTDSHVYIPPHPFLRDAIAHYTVRYPQEWPEEPAGTRLALVPDAAGCLFFCFDGNRLEQILWGATTLLAEVDAAGYQDEVHVFVEFRPGGLSRLLRGDVPALTNQRVTVEEVAPSLHRSVEELFTAAETMDEFLLQLDRYFISLIAPGGLPFLAQAALGRLDTQYDCGILVREIAREFGYSERHLNRQFSAAVGMPAKGYLKILRVNHAAALIHGTGQTLTDIAQAAGYYDQSHFIHDFQSVCGVSPSAYRAQRERFYREPFKLNQESGRDLEKP